jgi:hypothetical protein
MRVAENVPSERQGETCALPRNEMKSSEQAQNHAPGAGHAICFLPGPAPCLWGKEYPRPLPGETYVSREWNQWVHLLVPLIFLHDVRGQELG